MWSEVHQGLTREFIKIYYLIYNDDEWDDYVFLKFKVVFWDSKLSIGISD